MSEWYKLPVSKHHFWKIILYFSSWSVHLPQGAFGWVCLVPGLLVQNQGTSERGTGLERPKEREREQMAKTSWLWAGRVLRTHEKSGVDVAVGYKLKPRKFSLRFAGAVVGVL